MLISFFSIIFNQQMNSEIDLDLQHSQEFSYNEFYIELELSNKKCLQIVMTNMNSLGYYQKVLTPQYVEEQPNFKGTFQSTAQLYDYIIKNKSQVIVDQQGTLILQYKKGANAQSIKITIEKKEKYQYEQLWRSFHIMKKKYAYKLQENFKKDEERYKILNQRIQQAYLLQQKSQQKISSLEQSQERLSSSQKASEITVKAIGEGLMNVHPIFQAKLDSLRQELRDEFNESIKTISNSSKTDKKLNEMNSKLIEAGVQISLHKVQLEKLQAFADENADRDSALKRKFDDFQITNKKEIHNLNKRIDELSLHDSKKLEDSFTKIENIANNYTSLKLSIDKLNQKSQISQRHQTQVIQRIVALEKQGSTFQQYHTQTFTKLSTLDEADLVWKSYHKQAFERIGKLEQQLKVLDQKKANASDLSNLSLNLTNNVAKTQGDIAQINKSISNLSTEIKNVQEKGQNSSKMIIDLASNVSKTDFRADKIENQLKKLSEDLSNNEEQLKKWKLKLIALQKDMIKQFGQVRTRIEVYCHVELGHYKQLKDSIHDTTVNVEDITHQLDNIILRINGLESANNVCKNHYKENNEYHSMYEIRIDQLERKMRQHKHGDTKILLDKIGYLEQQNVKTQDNINIILSQLNGQTQNQIHSIQEAIEKIEKNIKYINLNLKNHTHHSQGPSNGGSGCQPGTQNIQFDSSIMDIIHKLQNDVKGHEKYIIDSKIEIKNIWSAINDHKHSSTNEVSPCDQIKEPPSQNKPPLDCPNENNSENNNQNSSNNGSNNNSSNNSNHLQKQIDDINTKIDGLTHLTDNLSIYYNKVDALIAANDVCKSHYVEMNDYQKNFGKKIIKLENSINNHNHDSINNGSAINQNQIDELAKAITNIQNNISNINVSINNHTHSNTGVDGKPSQVVQVDWDGFTRIIERIQRSITELNAKYQGHTKKIDEISKNNHSHTSHTSHTGGASIPPSGQQGNKNTQQLVEELFERVIVLQQQSTYFTIVIPQNQNENNNKFKQLTNLIKVSIQSHTHSNNSGKDTPSNKPPRPDYPNQNIPSGNSGQHVPSANSNSSEKCCCYEETAIITVRREEERTVSNIRKQSERVISSIRQSEERIIWYAKSSNINKADADRIMNSVWSELQRTVSTIRREEQSSTRKIIEEEYRIINNIQRGGQSAFIKKQVDNAFNIFRLQEDRSTSDIRREQARIFSFFRQYEEEIIRINSQERQEQESSSIKGESGSAVITIKLSQGQLSAIRQQEGGSLMSIIVNQSQTNGSFAHSHHEYKETSKITSQKQGAAIVTTHTSTHVQQHHINSTNQIVWSQYGTDKRIVKGSLRGQENNATQLLWSGSIEGQEKIIATNAKTQEIREMTKEADHLQGGGQKEAQKETDATKKPTQEKNAVLAEILPIRYIDIKSPIMKQKKQTVIQTKLQPRNQEEPQNVPASVESEVKLEKDIEQIVHSKEQQIDPSK